MASLQADRPCFEEVRKLPDRACQLYSWSPELWTDALARRVRREAQRARVHITAFWAGWSGPIVWDLVEGPTTLGLVPQAYRAQRVETLKKAGDFAGALGVPAVITHLGFIPENAMDPLFREVVIAVRLLAQYYQKHGLAFWFETGQETPVTMLRLIQQVGEPNLGINLDPANLILYGKGNPIDALDVFGTYVRNVHAKDALCPTDPMKLGKEVKVGEGRVRFPEFVRRLKALDYTGEFIIEREITGEQQRRDITATVDYLKKLLTGNA